MRAVTKTCEFCGAGILRDLRKDRRWCNRTCAIEAKKKQHRELNPRLSDGIPSGTVGAMAELLIAADLLNRGYEVFRAVSPACSCDLLIGRAGKIFRVEVKNAYRQKSGVLVVPRYDPSKSDVVAIFDRLTKTIVYRPLLEELGRVPA